jgi:hypothetical protein
MNSQKDQKERRIFEGRIHTGVMQDKDTPVRIYEAPYEPSYAATVAYRHPRVDTKEDRTQTDSTPAQMRPKHHGSNKRQLVEVAGCVPRHIAEQLERMRDQGGKGKRLSRSAVVAAIIVKGVQSNIDMQYGSMLKPVIETTIYNTIKSETSRSANLALEAFYSAEEVRILVVYLLRLFLGSDIDILPQIIKDAQDQARENVSMALHPRKEQN